MSDIENKQTNEAFLKIRPSFFYGFEFEGMVNSFHYNDFVYGLRLIDNKIRFGTDSSINNVNYPFKAVEFKTDKMLEAKAFRKLEEILCYLYIVSQENIFLTNESCGFHVNMSEQNILTYGKQFEFYSNIVWNFDEEKVLTTFGRTKSNYCRAFKKTNRCKDIKAIYRRIRHLDSIQDEIDYYHRIPRNKKYYCVALRENPATAERNNRIEFRAIGNKDYHLRLKDLTEAVSHIITVSKNSFSNSIQGIIT